MNMKTSLLPAALCHGLLALLLAAALPGQAQTVTPPNLMSYQGYLTDGNGNPLGSTNTGPKNYNVVFRLYNTQTTGTGTNGELYAEQQTVTVDNGYFSVLLGQGSQYSHEPYPQLSSVFVNPLATQIFVELDVLGIGAGLTDVKIAPRLQLLSSPYSFLAANANGLANSAGTSLLTTTAGGSLNLNGTLKLATGLGANTIVGDGSGLTALNPAQLSSGTVSSMLTLNNANNTFTGSSFTGGTGTFTGGSFAGNGSGLTALNANNITSGTLSIAQGGTGANTQNFVDLTSSQNIGGTKNFTGNVGIGTTTPAAPLQVNGNIMFGSGGANQAVAGDSSDAPLRIVRGEVALQGTYPITVGGAGFIIARVSQGVYSITFPKSFNAPPTVIVTVAGTTKAEMATIITSQLTSSGLQIAISDYNNNYVDMGFHFIAIGPR